MIKMFWISQGITMTSKSLAKNVIVPDDVGDNGGDNE
jgi:hypothetical protein